MRIARFTRDGETPRYGIVDGDLLRVLAGNPWDPVSTGEELPMTPAVRLLAPVPAGAKIIGVGRNYAAHAAELGNDLPATPLLFFKPYTAVTHPGADIELPSFSTEVHYEAELAVIIGTRCKHVPAADAGGVILGYTAANDVTARDIQRSDAQFNRAKGFDTSCPLGPWIETDLDPGTVRVQSRVDGVTRQDGTTADLIFGVDVLIEHISAAFTLLPGDVILTGTPAGVGPLHPGQTVEIDIEGVGVLTNPVITECEATQPMP